MKKRQIDDDFLFSEPSTSSSSSDVINNYLAHGRESKRTRKTADIDFDDVVETYGDDVPMEEFEYETLLLQKGKSLHMLQREAIEWMVTREVDAGGGLLMDEMGLGMNSVLSLLSF